MNSTNLKATAARVGGPLALWVAIGLLVGMSGQFPLNDDWAYALPTQTFLQTGRIIPLQWTWTPLVTQVLIGAGFSSLFGFSYETLRLAAFTCGGLGLGAAYWLARSCGLRQSVAVMATMVLAANPLFINMGFTFMLELPFTALLLLSLASLMTSVNGAGRPAVVRAGWLFAALLFMLAAILCRQTGVAVAAALVGALVLRAAFDRRALRRNLLIVGGAGVALAVGVLVVRALVQVQDIRRIAAVEFLLWSLRRPGMWWILLANVLVLVSYMGVFLSPIILWRLTSGHGRRWHWVLAGGGAAVALAMLIRMRPEPPPGNNVIYNFGVGPLTLVGGRPEVLNVPNGLLWLVVAFGLLCGAFALLWLLLDAFSSATMRRNAAVPTLVLFPIIFLAPQLVRAPFFDRYLIPAIVPLAVALLVMPSRPLNDGLRYRWPSYAVLACLVAFGVLGTRDYKRLVGASWSQAHELVNGRGISPMDIDGGFEFWGHHMFDGRVAATEEYDERRPPTRTYLISFVRRFEGYSPVSETSVHSDLLQREVPMFVHRRTEP